MTNVYTFDQDFTEEMGKFAERMDREVNAAGHHFSDLTLQLYKILGSVKRGLEKVALPPLAIEYGDPTLNDNVWSITINLTNRFEQRHLMIKWGGSQTQVQVEGVDDWSRFLSKLKGFEDNVYGGIVFDSDVDPEELAAAFASLFQEFYTR